MTDTQKQQEHLAMAKNIIDAAQSLLIACKKKDNNDRNETAKKCTIEITKLVVGVQH